MQSALHQNAGAAEFYCLVDPFADLFDRMNVSVRLSGPPIKRTERADDVANIGIIDVTVDYVRDDLGIVLALPYLVGGDADAGEIARLEQRCAILCRQPMASEDLVENRLNRG